MSFLGLSELQGENSVSSAHLSLVCHSKLIEFSVKLAEVAAELSELSSETVLSKQQSARFKYLVAFGDGFGVQVGGGGWTFLWKMMDKGTVWEGWDGDRQRNQQVNEYAFV